MTGSRAKRPLTLRDVAEAAGVDVSTVSRALRNDVRVADKTREKVQQVARDMGYRPNPFVSAFTAQVRGYRRSPAGATIAILNTYAKNHAFVSRYNQGARDRAENLGFNVDSVDLADMGGSTKRLAHVLHHRGIRGLMILPIRPELNLMDLDVNRLAVATIDLAQKTPNIHRAVPHYFQGMLEALRRLAGYGYRRIGFCTKVREVRGFGILSKGAYLAWQAERPASQRVKVHTDDAETEPKAVNRDAFLGWLEKQQPEAIVSNDDTFLGWAREAGLGVPEDLAFATLNRRPETPETAGIDQQQELVGAAAIDLVVGQIFRNEYGLPQPEKEVLVEGLWRSGHTVREQR